MATEKRWISSRTTRRTAKGTINWMLWHVKILHANQDCSTLLSNSQERLFALEKTHSSQNALHSVQALKCVQGHHAGLICTVSQVHIEAENMHTNSSISPQLHLPLLVRFPIRIYHQGQTTASHTLGPHEGPVYNTIIIIIIMQTK